MKKIIAFLEFLLDFILERDKEIAELRKLKPDEIFTNLKKIGNHIKLTHQQSPRQKDPAIKEFFTEGGIPVYICSIFSYKNPLIRKLIWQLKFKENKWAAKIFGTIMYWHLQNILETSRPEEKETIYLIPIPIHPKRKSERGYNQCQWLCEEIISAHKQNQGKISLFYAQNILIRIKYSQKQSWQNKISRQKSIENVFALKNMKKNKKILENQTVFLIDDVWTTGATLLEASKTIQQIKPKQIYVLTIAH